MQKGSCQLGFTPTPPPENSVDQLTPEKKAAIQEYAKKLKRKFPHMSNERIMRKVADFFHIKLVNNAKR